MRKNIFDCPRCGKKEAYQSSTYPNQVVCWCGTKTLELVGWYENKTFRPLDNQDLSKSNTSSDALSVGDFVFKEIKSLDECIQHGKTFNNALSMESFSKDYLSKGHIWVALVNNDIKNMDRNVIFYVTNSGRLVNFYRENNRQVLEPDNTVLKEFINNNIERFQS